MLSRLVFYGRTNMKIGESAGMIKSILAAASEYSPASGLTGGLVFNEKYVVEAIEGAREQVSKRLRLLFEDPRIEDLTVLAINTIDKRVFEGLGSGLCRADHRCRAALPEIQRDGRHQSNDHVGSGGSRFHP